jgi:hypothetical protein
MHITKNKFQGIRAYKGKYSILFKGLFTAALLLSSSAAFAVCQGTITATTPTAGFVDHGNGTVTHTKTGLMWKQCTEGLAGAGCVGTTTIYTWQNAMNQATAANIATFAGFSDWRLPNQKELLSIVEQQCDVPSVNATIFPATVSGGFYWSSSTYAVNGALAMGVTFNHGAGGTSSKISTQFVRLVRGGQ